MHPLAFISDDKIEKCYIQMTVILVAKIGAEQIHENQVEFNPDQPGRLVENVR